MTYTCIICMDSVEMIQLNGFGRKFESKMIILHAFHIRYTHIIVIVMVAFIGDKRHFRSFEFFIRLINLYFMDVLDNFSAPIAIVIHYYH